MISFLIEDNEKVKNFLEGDDTYIPISEYRYLHERPLIRPNFITQINDLVDKIAPRVEKYKPMTAVKQMSEYAIGLGTNLDGELTDGKIKTILFIFRGIYILCKDLDEKLK